MTRYSEDKELDAIGNCWEILLKLSPDERARALWLLGEWHKKHLRPESDRGTTTETEE